MHLDISKILGKRDLSIPFCLSEDIDEITSYPDVAALITPVRLEGTVTGVGLSANDVAYSVVASGSCDIAMFCSRCITPVTVSVCLKLDEKFSNAGISDEETETFSGDSIDLTSIVLKNMLANLPMKVLCSEDCKGLCSVCGQNLNEGDCGCDRTIIDPRFESLRSLIKFDEEV